MALSMLAHGVYAQNTAFRDSVELDPIVVTASHTPKTLKEAPVVTRLITRHDIKIADATNDTGDSWSRVWFGDDAGDITQYEWFRW